MTNNNYENWTNFINLASGLGTVCAFGVLFGKVMRGDKIEIADVAPFLIGALAHIATLE